MPTGLLNEASETVCNPNGIASHSPRLLYSATLGGRIARVSTPTGLRLFHRSECLQPLMPVQCACYGKAATPSGLATSDRLVLSAPPSPKVAEYGNPGLRDATTSWLRLCRQSVRTLRAVEHLAAL